MIKNISLFQKYTVFSIKALCLSIFLFLFLPASDNCHAFTKDEVDEFVNSEVIRRLNSFSKSFGELTNRVESEFSEEKETEKKKVFNMVFKEHIKAADLARAAITHMTSKDFDKAIPLLKKASKINLREGVGCGSIRYRFFVPDFLLAEIYESKGDFKHMRKHFIRFNKAIREVPENSPMLKMFDSQMMQKRMSVKFKEYGLDYSGIFDINLKALTTNFVIIITAIFAFSFVYWALSHIGLIPKFEKMPGKLFFEQLNMTLNILRSFKKQYASWLNNTPHEKVLHITSLSNGFREKAVKAFFPRKLISRVLTLCNLMAHFNEGKLSKEGHIIKKDEIIKEIDEISNICESLSKQYLSKIK